MSVRKSVDLCGKWNMGLGQHKEVSELKITTGQEFAAANLVKIDAQVPGNFELDMMAAGLLDSDPYFGLNCLKFLELEATHVWYQHTFEFNESISGEEYLLFEGIETLAEIFLNGKKIAQTDNMLIPHEIKLFNLRPGTNDLVVHIKPVEIEARKNKYDAGLFAAGYMYSALYTRKAAHMYGWDIMPRIVSAGIWRPCAVITKSVPRVNDVTMNVSSINLEAKTANFSVFFDTTIADDLLSDYRIRFTARCGDSLTTFEQRLWATAGLVHWHIDQCKFWWPRGMGAANLYDVTFELLKKGEVVDVYRYKTGIRTVALKRSSTADPLHGDFCIIVNGQRCFVKGTNWVPVDAFHSRDISRIPQILPMLTDLHCNAVRCWGGNVYENEIFYQFCDENGVMVWQDFAMACAMYPQDEDFQQVMRNEAEWIVKLLRNHCSIVLWAGDNECDMCWSFAFANTDPNTNKLTRKVLPEVLGRHDTSRPYLPSSPYYDETAYKSKLPLSEDHLWGPRDFYKSTFYTTATAHFASELGYHGCNSPQSIAKFISAEKVWPWNDNDEWLIHCTSPDAKEGPFNYRIKLMADQVKELIGCIPDTLEAFSYASQVSQAEANKFFIENFRGNKWQKSGIIWWNLIDGWPQFSDAVVDYFFEKKLAYHYIKRSQQDVLLMFREPRDWHIELVASNDTLQAVHVKYTVTDIANDDEVVMQGEKTIAANSTSPVQIMRYSLSRPNFYVIEWEYAGNICKNHYLAANPPLNIQQYKSWVERSGILDV